MPVPDFNSLGILPSGIHECTFHEAEERLVTTEKRRELWGKLEDFIDWVKPMGIFQTIYIDGSFLTDKPQPGDIDIYLEFATDLSTQTIDTRVFDWNYVFSTFTLDSYFGPQNLPDVFNDFRKFFQYVGVKEGLSRGIEPTERKGIIRVNL